MSTTNDETDKSEAPRPRGREGERALLERTGTRALALRARRHGVGYVVLGDAAGAGRGRAYALEEVEGRDRHVLVDYATPEEALAAATVYPTARAAARGAMLGTLGAEVEYHGPTAAAPSLEAETAWLAALDAAAGALAEPAPRAQLLEDALAHLRGMAAARADEGAGKGCGCGGAGCL